MKDESGRMKDERPTRAFSSFILHPSSFFKVQLTILDPRMRSALEACGLRRYEDYISRQLGEVVGRTGTTETRRIVLNDASRGETFYVKTYRYEDGRRRRRLARDKGRLEARNYRILRQQCRVNVPDVVSHGSRRRGWRLLDAFIMTRGVTNATPLDEYVRRRWPNGGIITDALQRYLLEETADLVSRMHAAGFFHIDLQWRNLLVSDDGSDRPPIYVIDSARGASRRWGVYQMHGRLRDLSSLYKLAQWWVSRREQIRWLRRYLGVQRLSACQHHALVQAILHDRSIKDNGTIQ